MRKDLTGILLICMLALGIQSCDTKEEPIPAYIQVDSISLSTSSEYGSNSQDINDLWVYVDNQYVGTYEIPFKVPVLPTGEVNIALETGIRDNGQGLFRVIYPFYSSFSIDTLLPEAGVITLNPQYKYEDHCVIPLLEDFEGLGNSFEKTPSSDTSLMTVIDSMSFEGHSGYIVLDAEHPQVDIRTSLNYELPRDSKVYLEIDYYCEEYLAVGLFGHEVSDGTYIDVRYPILTLKPTENWRKVYVNLTDQIANSPYSSAYRIFFSAEKTDLTEGKNARFYLDNIKMIHY